MRFFFGGGEFSGLRNKSVFVGIPLCICVFEMVGLVVPQGAIGLNAAGDEWYELQAHRAVNQADDVGLFGFLKEIQNGLS